MFLCNFDSLQVNSMFLTDVYSSEGRQLERWRNYNTDATYMRIWGYEWLRKLRSKETVRVEEHKVELEEGGVRLKLTVVRILTITTPKTGFLNSLKGCTFAVEGHIFVVYSTGNPEVILPNRTEQSKTGVLGWHFTHSRSNVIKLKLVSIRFYRFLCHKTLISCNWYNILERENIILICFAHRVYCNDY